MQFANMLHTLNTATLAALAALIVRCIAVLVALAATQGHPAVLEARDRDDGNATTLPAHAPHSKVTSATSKPETARPGGVTTRAARQHTQRRAPHRDLNTHRRPT